MHDAIKTDLDHSQVSFKNMGLDQASELTPVQILNTACFSLSAVKQFNELSSAYLKSRQLSSFAFVRTFDDGRAFLLHTNPRIAKYVVEHQVNLTSHIPEILLDDQFWYLPAKDGLHARLMHDLKQLGLTGSWVDLIVRRSGFFDLFCLGSPQDYDIGINQFLNLKEDVKCFFSQFHDRAKPLFQEMSTNCFQLPKAMQPHFKGLATTHRFKSDSETHLGLRPEKWQGTWFSSNSVTFTQREQDCIQGLMLGLTAKQIGQKLNLSGRTIEDYLNQIKEKLQCHKKSQILEALNALRLQ